MSINTISSREFNQNVSKAKRAAKNGPVFITDRGQPAHVLLSIRDYQQLFDNSGKIADLLAMPGTEDIELEIPRMADLARPAQMS